MTDNLFNITTGEDMTRIRVSCEHQSGLIYIVPAERSWVCTNNRLPAHAIAGFFRELVALQQPAVSQLMKDWGIYYRELPTNATKHDASEQASSSE